MQRIINKINSLWAPQAAGNSPVLPAVQNVLVLRTHIFNSFVQSTFEKLQQQLGAANVFLLYDETAAPCPLPATPWNHPGGIAAGPAVITINEAACQEINSLHNEGAESGSMYRVEAHVHACYKAIQCPYDYLWFMEYDVYCNDYAKMITACNGIAADMLTRGYKNRGLLKPANKPRWHWWTSLLGEMAQTPLAQRRGCFFPINRFSPRFLALLEQNLSRSSGYCEVYFPTLAHAHGLTVAAMPPQLFGTYRYQPPITPKEVWAISKKDYRLYHPVKSL